MSLHITSLVLFPMMLLASLTTTESLALPGCPGECGNLSIPFPFGIASDCYLDDSFLIICNRSYNPPKPFLDLGHAEVLSISLDGKIEILNSSTELMELGKRDRESLSVPVVIEWAAGNVACHTARDNASHYACQSQHSKCTDSSIGRGHICHCLAGYEGNPYLPDGCQDINECSVLTPCEHVCINLPGSFKCYCPEGLTGDGRKDGSGCHPKYQFARFVSVPSYFLGIIVLAPAIASTWIIWIHKEKKLLKHREKVFEQNGGNLLKRKVSMLKEQAKKNIILYTADDMRKATNNYGNQMVYKCRPGTCYLGRLAVNAAETEVVVMKIPSVPSSHTDQFIDQLIFLSQPHKNLVKIIGCCLETAVPLLVYEFHGERSSLFDQGHNEGPVLHFSGRQRMRVAAGVSRGLAYLHSKNSRPIVHGNVSSANILISNSNEAKLFYVAASNLTPQEIHSSNEENSVHRPPEFSISGQLKQKSDVYSFGKVLAELLPGWETNAPTRNKSEEREQQVKEDLALLAAKCLSEKPEDRPNMKDVKAKLIKLTTKI